MTVRQRKQWIVLAAALVALVGAGLLAMALVVPVRVAIPSNATDPQLSPPQASETPTASEPAVTLADLERIAAMDLRHPLDDPSPMAPAGSAPLAPPSGPPPAISLVATILEPGHSMAVFRKAGGALVLCPQGQRIDDADGGPIIVTAVEREKVVVEYGGYSHELLFPPKPAPSSTPPAASTPPAQASAPTPPPTAPVPPQAQAPATPLPQPQPQKATIPSPPPRKAAP